VKAIKDALAQELSKHLDFAVTLVQRADGKIDVILSTESLVVYTIDTAEWASAFGYDENIGTTISGSGRGAFLQIAESIKKNSPTVLANAKGVPDEIGEYAGKAKSWRHVPDAAGSEFCKCCISQGRTIMGVISGPGVDMEKVAPIVKAKTMLISLDGSEWKVSFAVCDVCSGGIWSFKHYAVVEAAADA
tara:strand:- start:54688 stop:55257 length:570 start_codon:yes stop_codon:yes gene_type:complete